MKAKLSPAELAATWIVEQERAGVPALIGTEVRIEVQQVNPFCKHIQITPTKASAGDSKFAKIFEKIKPMVVMIEGDTLMCSMGILAKRKK